MGGIYIDMDAFIQRLTDEFNELFAPLQVFIVTDFRPRRSFWQRLKDEIAARPRVF